ncbi:uncharacterized protein LOC134184461 [Corticium candelabrum]|uniref:uncharacterized protein LOC134184461 n=1 Tax=Corticium candelabrum TaxID=121492 RepID=UPI002E333F1B|nr:uncharacterized protein LOC134184461 [Corticium candelabrum]
MGSFQDILLLPSFGATKTFFKRQQFVDLLDASLDDSGNVPPALRKGIWDVWHGNVWRQLKDNRGCQFFSDEFSIGLTLNVDWFCPFSRSPYKVGVMFMSVLNLPRKQRMKQRWTMLVGIIPGPSEPKLHINDFLRPLVDDLELLWNGIEVVLADGSIKAVKAALVCVSCDLPASRKVLQFLGHKSDLGCSKCKFQAERAPGTHGASGKMSYLTNGETSLSIPLRSGAEVRQQALTYRDASTKAQQDHLAKTNGVRYSELLRLPYFDPVEMTAVDPMHCFFLGLVSHEISLILGTSNDSFSMLSANQVILKQRIKALNQQLPLDIGRLPGKVVDSDHRAKMTAAQWKHFIVIYARACFIKLVLLTVYTSLRLLAEVVELLIDDSPTQEIIDLIEVRIQRHHEAYCKAYGKWNVPVNYQMALHTADCMNDFGPANNFWLFACERENAVVGNAPTNGISIEGQI